VGSWRLANRAASWPQPTGGNWSLSSVGRCATADLPHIERATRHERVFPGHDGLHKYPGHTRYRAVDASDGRNAHDVMGRPNNRAPTRRSGVKSQSAGMPSEPHPNGRSVARCANAHGWTPRTALSMGAHDGVGKRHRSYGRSSDNGPLSLLRLPRGCVAGAFAVLEPGKHSQRLLKLVVVGIGPPGSQLPADGDGFLDRSQRVLRPAQVGDYGRQVVQ
jgi:hypothetical protein